MIPIRNVITTIGKITHKRMAGSRINSAILKTREQMTQHSLRDFVNYTGAPMGDRWGKNNKVMTPGETTANSY